jgi:hypothetical protein
VLTFQTRRYAESMRAACTVIAFGSKDCDVQVIMEWRDNAIKQSSLHAVELGDKSSSQWSSYGSEVHQHLLQHLQVLARHFVARLVVVPSFTLVCESPAEQFCRKTRRESPAKIDFMIQWTIV